MIALTLADRQRLRALRKRPQRFRWNSPTLSRLRRAGLVDMAIVSLPDGRLSNRPRWSITDLGLAELESRS